MVPPTALRAAVANLTAMLPPDADPAGEWRAELIERYAVVRALSCSSAEPEDRAAANPGLVRRALLV